MTSWSSSTTSTKVYCICLRWSLILKTVRQDHFLLLVTSLCLERIFLSFSLIVILGRLFTKYSCLTYQVPCIQKRRHKSPLKRARVKRKSLKYCIFQIAMCLFNRAVRLTHSYLTMKKLVISVVLNATLSTVSFQEQIIFWLTTQ